MSIEETKDVESPEVQDGELLPERAAMSVIQPTPDCPPFIEPDEPTPAEEPEQS